MKKYIFDLDGTILQADWDMEDKFFESILDKDSYELFHEDKMKTVNDYEKTHDKYDIYKLSEFYKERGINLTPDHIRQWIEFNAYYLEDEIDENIYELLELLKEDDKEIALLTNWFKKTQVERLRRKNILDYFDNIVSGDEALKPSKQSYDLAVKNTPKEECIMIGDNYKKDYLGALNYGINAYLVNKDNDINKILEVVKDDRRSKRKIK